ncbi:YicC/YloC family endoribonuclease [Psychrobium sp. 1_MG-2023]|uniref:YicC/YloC family endoribonuclease n=1 Tax=Psychrobium sp. 1_MG-2023 TaxID=3062624 RepID=UPI000C324C37|nr:YicC/YloC family endoribonuclease [Psychrobium sp. 1_MG-2023]MDP2562820.1 YicC/YloC family endoribonuclease [Psychrobium sp. 1_MG-2023]PKF57959.1 YicC family protein [Alteromonadales bacterium alter-6D02]
MIHSMTAFARQDITTDWGQASWEIRSVNQRYLETYIRLPDHLRSLEPILRERFRKRLQRGKLECNLRIETKDNSHELQINKALASQVISQANWVLEQAGTGSLNPVDVLKWPGVIALPEQDMTEVNQLLLAQFDQTLSDFIKARASEGENLKTMITTRLAAISKLVGQVREQMPDILVWQRERLMAKFEDVKIEVDNNRIEQELIMLAQKVDVAEELDRLDSHVSEAQKIMKKGGACGRRLDFMMQEFNREANTLASKSINHEITQASVELKVLIEQMREQIQNIE